MAATNGHTNGASTGTSEPLSWTTFSNTINGKLETTQKTRHSINPATGEAGPDVPLSTPDDVERAVAAAQVAFGTWAEVPYTERRVAVLAYADAIAAEKESFSQMLTKEQGKPLKFARVEMDLTVHWLKTIANLELPEERIVEGDREIVVRYTPLGVTVGIVPWNYPILLAASKIAPCVVTGNPIIIKPSPFTPAGDLKLVELAQRFFPPGVVQCLSGDDNLGPWLTAHPVPAKISFTGSTLTGKKVMESAAKTLKRVTLELGGNDPAVVLDDVDIEDVAPKVAGLAFLNSGQICLALKRVLVHESIADKFLAAMVQATQQLKVGPGDDPDVYLGPIQNSMQYERVKGFFADIEKENWKVAVGGSNPDGPGYFITPTIIDRPKDDSRIVKEEPFGPIVPLITFKTDEEAIKKANDTHMGLGASVWSSDTERANRLAQKIQAGTVWVNTHFELDPRVPFGGHKESGVGSEWGLPGLKSFCNSQTLFLKRNTNV
ncbi:NAD-dependent aldehyde dehydrogenase [Exophiala aquamarina CBS 119918]|uniref:aldehyde dehydrogenase (NAD(+)) n=1 Tax=Exophiala aquamarina CBS 119918 TaxID=1182545 RepID=A0A072PDG7_9EURO|nr:NAD-dependent aldehyde dehydrogenase [Exophiala aquamarina CBS 119918]KEF57318.1 NAD-dependent aldehyde dehydrogenase [Exophiala aquamarina CBS 119918]